MPIMPPSCAEGPRQDWFEDERLPSDKLKNASRPVQAVGADAWRRVDDRL
jgi:hypothetical protein